MTRSSTGFLNDYRRRGEAVSTRAHIAIYPLGVSMAQLLDEEDKLVNRKWEALLYVHSNGYPTRLLRQVKDFHHRFTEPEGYDGAYFAARLIQHLANKYDEGMKKYEYSRYSLYGFGITRVMVGDFSWFYAVTQDGVVVFHRSPGSHMKLVEFIDWDDPVKTSEEYLKTLEEKV